MAGATTAVLELPPLPQAAPLPANGGGLKKLSFGIAKKKEETKTAYPEFPDVDGKAAEIADRILKRSVEFEALKGALEIDKAELKFMVAPHYFEVNHRRHEVPSSVAVYVKDEQGRKTSEVLVTFQNRYPILPDESSLRPILGALTDKFFRQSYEVKIKGDSIPTDCAQELMNELQMLFTRFNCLDALELKEGIKPSEQFHAARHVELTPAMNLQLEQACPIVAMVKTKGRK